MPSEVFRNLERLELNPDSMLTVGSFDGVHLGHQLILDELKQQAKAKNCNTTVVTFEPHPRLVLTQKDQQTIKILSTVEEKIALFKDIGIDRIVVLPFTHEFSQTSSEKFVRDFLFHKIGMQGIVIGHDHVFGKNRHGDVAILNKLSNELNFTVSELAPFEHDHTVISSTKIRNALVVGEIDKANQWLGKKYGFSGRVVAGEGKGREIGFPTANLELLHKDKLIPANGVYCVLIKNIQQNYYGMMNIGTRPTFGGLHQTREVHIFDFSENLYQKILDVELIAYLRPEQKFETPDALIAQLQNDKNKSLRYIRRQKNI